MKKAFYRFTIFAVVISWGLLFMDSGKVDQCVKNTGHTKEYCTIKLLG